MPRKDPEARREYNREYHKRRYEENRERILVQTREWAIENPDKVKGYQRKYKQKNKERDKLNRKHQKVGRRSYWLSKYKTDKGCMICGYKDHAVALDFDHVDPKNKSFTIARSLNYDLKILFAEIRKCQLLCSNCHRVKTHREAPH